jgi:BTB/POZ domain
MIDPRDADSYDVKFLVGPQKLTVRGNKIGLAYTSTVFHRMFFSDFPSENEIIVPEVDADAFGVMINSISGREVILNGDNVAQVYYLAEKYDLSCLRQLCKTCILNSIDSTNALTILTTFWHYNEPVINEKCLAIILDDPLSFFKNPDFLTAPAAVVRSVFESNCINCSTKDVKNALIKWITKNVPGNSNEEDWVETVKTQYRITREELEMEMMRQHFALVLEKGSKDTADRDLGKNSVEKEGIVSSIQDVFFEKLKLVINSLETMSTQSYIQSSDEKSCLSELILSSMR